MIFHEQNSKRLSFTATIARARVCASIPLYKKLLIKNNHLIYLFLRSFSLAQYLMPQFGHGKRNNIQCSVHQFISNAYMWVEWVQYTLICNGDIRLLCAYAAAAAATLDITCFCIFAASATHFFRSSSSSLYFIQSIAPSPIWTHTIRKETLIISVFLFRVQQNEVSEKRNRETNKKKTAIHQKKRYIHAY